MPVGDILPEIAVLAAAIATLLLASFFPKNLQWLGAPLSVIGLGASGILCAAQLAGPPRLTFAATWALDGASIWGRLLIVTATAFCVLLTPEWMRADRRHGEYYCMLLLSALGAMMMAGAADTLQLLMGVLLSSVTGYTLAAYHRDWGLSVEAGMKYFLLGAFANTLLLLGVSLLFGFLGNTNYDVMASVVARMPRSGLLLVALALAVVGVAFKLGAAPAHAWLPDVAQGAPAPAAAFLTVIPKVGAAIALARLLHIFPSEAIGWRPLLAAMAVATMTIGNLAALWQTDVRRLLGWSSVSQSGYALMAVTVVDLTNQAVLALLIFLAGYAAANLAAFAVIAHLRGRTDLDHYRGLATTRPWVAAVLASSFLSLVGIPPLAGFVGKLTLFVSTIDAGYAWLAAVAVVNTAISLFYYLRVLGPIYFHRSAGQVAVLGHCAAVTMLLTGACVLFFGLGAEALVTALRNARLLP